MKSEFEFGPFRLECGNARLCRGSDAIPLKPKVFDVLAYLVRRAGKLVTQEELLRDIWPDTIVGDSSLKSCIRQIRRALHDRVRSPLFIETVHRRGYRFIANVATIKEGSPALAVSTEFRQKCVPQPVLVGRDQELNRLREMLELARSGQRQVVFVTGGPGSGKTTLIEAFLHRIGGETHVHTAGGQCFEQYGSGEAYLPVLDSLAQLGRTSAREKLMQVLGNHAPSWLGHLASFRANASVSEPIGVLAASPERMLREMAEAIERFTANETLVLVLEDMHWADYSTVDLVSALSRRREPASLFVIVTYRPVDTVLSNHPLRTVKQDLMARGICAEVPVGLLDHISVSQYLATRFPEGGLPTGLDRFLHERTEGQPLFLVHLIDDWLAQGMLELRLDSASAGWELRSNLDDLGKGVPASVRALIEKQLDRLDTNDLRILEAASVAGVDFRVAAAAAGAETDAGQAEDACEKLSRRHQFLQPQGSGEWPDGSVSSHYRFRHELYHRVVFENISPARRRLLHRNIGHRMETAYGQRTAEVSPELALHFEQAADAKRAMLYCEMSADRASRNFAHREAIDYLRRAMAMILRIPEEERLQAELRVQVNLGLQLQITQGFAAPLANRAYLRARELCEGTGETRQLFPVLWGIWLYHKVRSELPKAMALADQLFALAKKLEDPALTLQAHQALAVTSLCLGNLAQTIVHMDHGTALYDPKRHHFHTFQFGQDPGVACQAFGAVALWLSGDPRRAIVASRAATQRSHELVQPSSQALALVFGSIVHQCCRDVSTARACAELAIAIAEDQGFSFWSAGGKILRGWALANSGQSANGIAILNEGLNSWQATGSQTYRTYFLGLLAETLLHANKNEEASAVLDEALQLVETSSERFYEAELHRLRGESLNIKPGRTTEAIACFRKAVDVARNQNAKSLELRALTSLVRSTPKGRARGGLENQLSHCLASSTADSDSPDVGEANSLLATHRRRR